MIRFFFQFAEKFLGMRSDLRRASRSNCLFHSIPVLAERAERIQECLVLVSGPSALRLVFGLGGVVRCTFIHTDSGEGGRLH